MELTIGFNAVAGPDGKTWGVMVINSGAVNVQVPMPEVAVKALSEKLPQDLAKLLKEVHQANTGLVVSAPLNKDLKKALNPLMKGLKS